MNKVEFKEHFLGFGNGLIDQCFPDNGALANKFINTTCKYIYKNKLNDVDPIINLFADKDGNIDANDFVCYMKEHLIGNNGLRINLRDYVTGGSSMASLIPDKTIIITLKDLDCFLSGINA